VRIGIACVSGFFNREIGRSKIFLPRPYVAGKDIAIAIIDIWNYDTSIIRIVPDVQILDSLL
jgi:hypothetical protein